MTPNLTDHTVLITGASRGIGEAAARVMAQAGANVVLAARTTKDIDAIAGEIIADGGKAEAVACDVADYAQVEAAVAKAKSAFGSLTGLINNAGIIDPVARLAESDPAAWGKVMDINIKGVYHGARAAIPVMQETGGGTIINISSGAATNPLEGWSHYCTSKAAVLMITRSLHHEYAADGIRALGLSPGTVATNMQKVIKASGVNRVSELPWDAHIPPEWVGKALAWMLTEDAREFDGGDVSLREEAIRRRVGLIA